MLMSLLAIMTFGAIAFATVQVTDAEGQSQAPSSTLPAALAPEADATPDTDAALAMIKAEKKPTISFKVAPNPYMEKERQERAEQKRIAEQKAAEQKAAAEKLAAQKAAEQKAAAEAKVQAEAKQAAAQKAQAQPQVAQAAGNESAQGTFKLSFYDPAVLGSNMGYAGVAANLSVFPKGTRLKITLSDGTVWYRVVNDTGTFAYSNPRQLDVAMPNSQIPSAGILYATVSVVG